MDKLLIVDANSLIHRAFHALPPMNNDDGTPTQAVYGFFNTLLKVLNDEQPTHLLIGFDMHGKTFRHERFAEYKAGRAETPDELRVQFPLIKEVLFDMHIAICEKEGLEADDVLGTYAHQGEAAGMNVRLLTGDRDSLQLVSSNTFVLLAKSKMGQSEIETVDPAAVMARYGVTPAQMLDVKALMGDSSDNIPGVPGIGEKTALKLIAQYKTLDDVYAHIDEISGAKLNANLREFKEQAYLSRDLAKILTDAPFSVSLDETRFVPTAMSDARDKLLKLRLRTLLSRLPVDASSPAPVQKNVETRQITNAEQLKDTVQTLMKQTAVSLVWEDSLSLSGDSSLEYNVNLQHTLLQEGVDWAQALEIIAPLLASAQPQKILFDAKRWMHALKERGYALSGLAFDAMLGAYLLSPVRSKYELPQLCDDYSIAGAGAAALFSLGEAIKAKLDRKSVV